MLELRPGGVGEGKRKVCHAEATKFQLGVGNSIKVSELERGKLFGCKNKCSWISEGHPVQCLDHQPEEF